MYTHKYSLYVYTQRNAYVSASNSTKADRILINLVSRNIIKFVDILILLKSKKEWIPEMLYFNRYSDNLRADRPRNWGSIPGRYKNFLSSL